MSKQVRAIIITGNGTNCEVEMRHACRLAGADVADIVHISSLLYGEVQLDDYDFLNLPGGFLDGDDLGAAKAAANRILRSRIVGSGEPLREQFLRFIDAGKLILGVCNGFQLLVKLGFLPRHCGDFRQSVTLTNNDSGVFEDRWVELCANPASPCVFTKGLAGLYLPVRHGEGKLVARDEATLAALEEGNLAALRYSKLERRDADAAGLGVPTSEDYESSCPFPSNKPPSEHWAGRPPAPSGWASDLKSEFKIDLASSASCSSPASEASAVAARACRTAVFGKPTMEYPHNPNGSANAIAGLCDPTGRILGLMPHPEAYLHFTNHPRWTRERELLPEAGMGLAIFQNAVEFIRSGGC